MSGGHYHHIYDKTMQEHASDNSSFAEIRGDIELTSERLEHHNITDTKELKKFKSSLNILALEISQYWHALKDHYGRYPKQQDEEAPEDLQLWHEEICSLLKDIEWYASGDIAIDTLVDRFGDYLVEKTPRTCNTCGTELGLLDCQSLDTEITNEPVNVPRREAYCSQKCRTAEEL